MYLDKFNLTGQIAFITGGGRGIGLASAEALLEAGAYVVISDHNSDVLEAGRAELDRKGHEVGTMLLDVTDVGGVGRTAAEANARYGGIDILIANAGIAWPDTPGEFHGRRGLAQGRRRRSQRRILDLSGVRSRDARKRPRFDRDRRIDVGDNL